jgi:hypothetical protein
MSRAGHLVMVVLLAAVPLASAAEVQPGDQVRLVEREPHIPAHPAPGDSRVLVRFVSGTEAAVLQVNPTIGWIQVRRQPLEGTANTRRITPSYRVGYPGGGDICVEHRRTTMPTVRDKEEACHEDQARSVR